MTAAGPRSGVGFIGFRAADGTVLEIIGPA
jgi:hypothetical protein